MFTTQALFEWSNSFALLTWIILLIAPFKQWTIKLVLGFSVTLLAVLYSYLAFTTFDAAAFESFGSLDGIMSLFTNPEAMLAGWIHYLAFDLMVGLYIVIDAKKKAINRWIIIPSLLFTFMLGPFGLLTYLLIRLIITKKHLTY
ncbi:MAG: hypothetical protein ACI8QD_001956 [Cyclobacteriaceae bacterium]|jgi:hypothetical protein